MSSREEKLAAARKKLREFQGKSRQDGDSGQQASRKNSTATNSPTPSYAGSDSRILIGTESPFEPNRLAYERRETVQISESPLHNRPTSRPTPPYEVGINTNANNVQSENVVTDNSSILLQMQGHIEYLQNQLVARDQAISVLVTERNDAHSELSRVQSELQHKADSIEVINSKYLEASKRIYELDNASPRPMTSVMVTQVEEELRAAQEIAAQKIAQLEERLQEHKFRLEAKSSECDILGSQVQTLSNSLSVAEVKIQQLTTEESQKTNSREAELGEENGKLKKEIQLLGRKLQAAAMEGEQAAHRFQQYADQCNSQQNALKAQVQELSRLYFMLKEEKTSIAAEFERFKSDISATRSEEGPLEERIGVLNKEKAQLFQQLQEKEAQVSSMASQLEELKGHRDSLLSELELVSSKLKEAEAQLIGGHADPALLAAIESDKVAASRAVSQNQQLKQQLTELQLAFIRVSDEKLELTDKLLNAQHENSVLKNLAGNDEKGGIRLDQLQGKVAEILTGLQRHRQNCDLKHSKETKENQCNDHDGSHSHDHSHGHNHDHGHGHSHDHGHEHHHHEEAADGELEALIKLTADVFEGLRPNPSHESHASQNHGHSHSHGDHNHDHDHDHKHSGDEYTEGDHHHLNNANQSEVDELRRVIKQLQADKDLLLQRLGSPIEDPEVQGLLEVKLRRTMDEIAVLDEEKQRLEHMVVQLQEETETIGEYITLYHKQRLLLKQRAVEKDEQLIELAKDREDLKQKLSSLNQLVSNLVSGNSAVADMNVESAEPLQDTADKIHSLITEIGKNKVVSAQQTAFDQCACCSGRLITI